MSEHTISRIAANICIHLNECKDKGLAITDAGTIKYVHMQMKFAVQELVHDALVSNNMGDES